MQNRICNLFVSPYGAFSAADFLCKSIWSGRTYIILCVKCGGNDSVCNSDHIFNQLDCERNFQDWVREDKEKDKDKEKSEEFVGTKGTFGKCPFILLF